MVISRNEIAYYKTTTHQLDKTFMNLVLWIFFLFAGGYCQNFPGLGNGSQDIAKAILEVLISQNWMDRSTRIVSYEITAFNPSLGYVNWVSIVGFGEEIIVNIYI